MLRDWVRLEGRGVIIHMGLKEISADVLPRLRLDPQKRSLVLDDGTEVFFDKCLLATAGKPRQFYVLDYEKVRNCAMTP